MTKKDYELIAYALKNARRIEVLNGGSISSIENTIGNAVDILIPELKKDNPKFDSRRFKIACGLIKIEDKN